MRVGIFIRNGKEDASCVKDFVRELEKNSVETFVMAEGCRVPDILAVFGGDGTILKCAEYACFNGIPIVAVNIGTLGFLSAYESDAAVEAARKIARSEIGFSSRTTLSVSTASGEFFALNDMVIERDKSVLSEAVMSKLSLTIDGTPIYDLSSDGVIIATPTGSTAYSLSAGGVILTPGLNSFIATPICSHSLTSRPIVYDDDSVAEIRISDSSCGCILSRDGRPVCNLVPGDTVRVSKGKNRLLLADCESNFYTKIRKKLG